MSDLRVYKYPLTLGTLTVEMPRGGKPLHVAMQSGLPCLWALVDADNASESRCFTVVGTGHPVPDGEYVATTHDGPFVWHVFDTSDRTEVASDVASDFSGRDTPDG